MSILSYFDPQIALKSQIPTGSGVCYIHFIILYISKSNWRDGDHFIESDGALVDFGPFSGKIGGQCRHKRVKISKI